MPMGGYLTLGKIKDGFVCGRDSSSLDHIEISKELCAQAKKEDLWHRAIFDFAQGSIPIGIAYG